MTEVQVKRRVSITVNRTIEVLGSKLSTDDAGGMWVSLNRKCHACGKRFKLHDSITLAMYVEDGEQKSGGFHTDCLGNGK